MWRVHFKGHLRHHLLGTPRGHHLGAPWGYTLGILWFDRKFRIMKKLLNFKYLYLGQFELKFSIKTESNSNSEFYKTLQIIKSIKSISKQLKYFYNQFIHKIFWTAISIEQTSHKNKSSTAVNLSNNSTLIKTHFNQ